MKREYLVEKAFSIFCIIVTITVFCLISYYISPNHYKLIDDFIPTNKKSYKTNKDFIIPKKYYNIPLKISTSDNTINLVSSTNLKSQSYSIASNTPIILLKYTVIQNNKDIEITISF